MNFRCIISEAKKAPPFKSLIDPNYKSFASPDDMRDAIREKSARRTGQTVPDGVGPGDCVFESLAMALKAQDRPAYEIAGRKIDRIHVIGGE